MIRRKVQVKICLNFEFTIMYEYLLREYLDYSVKVAIIIPYSY